MKGKNSKKISLKYTAARLHEKGVLLEIEDLQSNQWVSFKNSLELNNLLGGKWVSWIIVSYCELV